MNLKEFVKSVLIDLDNAVEEARGETQRDVSFSNTKEQRTVEFDIAVSVEEADKKSGKAGIKVLKFAEGGGGISKENKSSTVSRVQFGVNISSITKREKSTQRAELEARNRDRENDYM